MYARIFKRGADVIAASAALLLLSPLLILIVVTMKIFDTGPVIFEQQRVGQNGHLFTLYKFRSMPVDTGSIPSHQIEGIRLTWLGKLLRRSNMDELPQLFNILKGDMSLVGPRPPIRSQTELIALRRESGALSCRPGLTGLAQVNSFDGMTVVEKARFDAQYSRSVSLWRDAVIVLRTFLYLLRPPPKY